MNRKEQILQETWSRLQSAVRDRKDPFHSLAVATVDSLGHPHNRIVTLRHADPAQRVVRFHVDVRSPKFNQLQTTPHAALLFHSVEDKLQLRLDAKITLHTDDNLADEAWASSRLLSRRCYCQTLPNGTPVDQPSNSLPEGLENRQPTEEEAAAGRPNFCVVACHVYKLDWYSLAFTGHQRAVYHWANDAWEAHWAVP